MDVTEAAEALFGRLAEVAPAEDVAEVRAGAEREAMRLRHPVVVPAHVLSVLVRGGAEPTLLDDLGVSPSATPAQLLDRAKAEVDAHATGAPAPSRDAEALQERPSITRSTRAVQLTCPECGETGPPRFQARRVPAPDGRGSSTTRVATCAACGAEIGA